VVCCILADKRQPKAGDLVLARVTALGHHDGLQLISGRRRTLFVGDEIVVAYGNRYASNQFEAIVPETLGPCHLVAGGGVAAKAINWHARITRGATQITPIGLIGDAAGQPLNLRDYGLPTVDRLSPPYPNTIAVVGTAMDSGKTQTCAYLVKGLTTAGLRVGYAKVTGTGAGGDTWLLTDAGADPVLDFTDAGHVSTYLASEAEIRRIFRTLMAHAIDAGVDAVVLELADGVLQQETAALLLSDLFRSVVGGLVMAARDSMGAVAGCEWFRRHGLPIVGLAGVVTSAPLEYREAARATHLPLFTRDDLARPGTALDILAHAESNRADSRGSVAEVSDLIFPTPAEEPDSVLSGLEGLLE